MFSGKKEKKCFSIAPLERPLHLLYSQGNEWKVVVNDFNKKIFGALARCMALGNLITSHVQQSKARQLTNFDDHIWSYMIIHDPIWTMYDNIWTTYDHIWSIYDHI